MKTTSYLMTFMTLVSLSLLGCKGDDGPAGPSGPPGDDANFQVRIITIPSADWGSSGYVEYPCNIITQDVMNQGMVIAYIQDDFGYYDGIPSAFHEVTGYGYVYDAVAGGIVGFECDPASPPLVNRQAKVVAMSASFLKEIEDRSVLQSHERLMRYLQTQK
ncbi:MAG: hypothetical protein ACKOYC_09565 [Bacteroidota bacterium]